MLITHGPLGDLVSPDLDVTCGVVWDPNEAGCREPQALVQHSIDIRQTGLVSQGRKSVSATDLKCEIKKPCGSVVSALA